MMFSLLYYIAFFFVLLIAIPLNGSFYLKFDKATRVLSFTVFSIDGRVIKNQTINNELLILPLELTKREEKFIIVRIETDQGVIMRKFFNG